MSELQGTSIQNRTISHFDGALRGHQVGVALANRG
jgi:hypothetical protein